MPHNYSVLVNSSDGFEDCWAPFFTLFQKYWPQCRAPIYLNTENKVWQHPTLAIECTAVQRHEQQRLTWSECLIRALDSIHTPLVLYFQEDYFIHKPVRAPVIAAAVDLMLAHPEVKHIGLTQHGSFGPYDRYPIDGFCQIRQKARYRISTQAGLWRTETLRSYLRPEENGWMFEIYGTRRAQRRSECFLCADFDTRCGGPAIDYLHTGIIKGKWLPAIPEIFAANGIVVEYSRRGFYQPKSPLLRKLEVARKLLEHPGYLLKQWF